jgi:hypothetical protein
MSSTPPAPAFVPVPTTFTLKVGMPLIVRSDHSMRGDARNCEIADAPTKFVVYLDNDGTGGTVGVGPAIITDRVPSNPEDFRYFRRNDVCVAPITEADLKKTIAAETKRLKDAYIASRDAAKIAKKAELERVAKVKKQEEEAKKALAKLSPAGKRIVNLMKEKPRLLSDYRDSAIAIAEAYTGDKLAVLLKQS